MYNIHQEGLATIRKALTSSIAGTQLLQELVDTVIPMLVDYRNPLRVNLPTKQGSGQYWILNRRTSGSTPAVWVADTDTATEDTGTYERMSFLYRTVLTKGQVTRKLQRTGASYIDVLMEEIEAKILDFKDYEEAAFTNGVSSATTPEGIQYLCTDNQMVAMTTAQGGAPMTLAKMDEAFDLNIGDPDMIIMTRRSRRELNALLQAQQRFNDVTVNVKGGFRLQTFNDVPIYTSTRVPNTQFFNGTTEQASTGGSSSSVYFVDTNHLWRGELTPIRLLPLAKTTSQYDSFEIYCDEVLVLRNPLKISKLIGIWQDAA